MASPGTEIEGHNASASGTTTGPGQPCSTTSGELVDDDGISEADAGGRHDTGREVSIDLDLEAQIQSAFQRATALRSEDIGSLQLKNDRCYLPEMDSIRAALTYQYMRVKCRRISLRLKKAPFLTRHVYSSDRTSHHRKFLFGEFSDLLRTVDKHAHCDVNIYALHIPLCYIEGTEELAELLDALDFAPAMIYHLLRLGMPSLGRRLTGGGSEEKYLDMWFQVPLMMYLEGEAKSALDMRGFRAEECTAIFYLRYGLATGKTTVLVSKEIDNADRILKYSEGCTRGERLDPLGMLCGAVAMIFHRLMWDNARVESFIRKSESFAFRDSEKPDKGGGETLSENALELQQMIPIMLGRLETCRHFQNVLRNALDEHESLRGVIDVHDDIFQRIHKNLQTLLSSAEAHEAHYQSRMKSIEMCLSVLSSVRSSRNDRANISQMAKENSDNMERIALETKRDARAMRTIATMTMVYLPATLVATLIGVNIFNFDFDGGKAGAMSVSRHWWVYLFFAAPLTAATVRGFGWAVQRWEKAKEESSEAPGK